ncbi:hypothetical protein DFQ01_10644 [Paenibacillus cellulosilyticus]|uniref:Uncharacterized protein n=1 Tax=Paenibacillus cellulosilyticus TaxID=375489 RepID=A0A2V2YYF4_9BACL|nr:hypothetical protein [Paenibacillus cellulosilyticus]PWW04762.1 hypothetical protein DFQ01_10644 [Paenibacillus cellulosilyticus]QKS45886.1 hypothetical protein HUB94_16625 [Paenibacillus cellulosilyticus]
MPELLPEYDALLAAMPNQPDMAQLIAQYNLRPFFSGCSSSVSHRLGHSTLMAITFGGQFTVGNGFNHSGFE